MPQRPGYTGHSLRRKLSNMSILGLSRSASGAPSSNSRPVTPLSATPSTRKLRKRKSVALRQLFNMHRVQEPEFEMRTTESRCSQSTLTTPQISKLGKAFVDSLNTRQLSEFLIWMLYHEVVELPGQPDIWYSLVDPVDMRGWIALGDFLSKYYPTTNTGSSFDIVVMDSICDRLDLQRSTVHDLLVHFADPVRMAFSQIATLINAANSEKLAEIEVLEIAQSKFREYGKLVAHLTPTEGSVYDAWRMEIQKRLHGISNLVLTPRIASLCYGVPPCTAAFSEDIPQEAMEGVRLKYLFELVQQERQVPLSRYGIYSDPLSLGSMTTSPSSPDVRNSFVHDFEDAEYTRNHAVQLLAQFHELRAQVASLQQEKEKLQVSNEKLLGKIASLSHNQQPSTHSQSPTVNNNPHASTTRSPCSNFEQEQDRNYLQAPAQDTSATLSAALDQNSHSTANHSHQGSGILSRTYEDIFEPLDTPPSPPIRLSDPATGESLQPTVSGRRSGMLFSKDQVRHLGTLRNGTPSPPASDEDHSDEGDWVETPTPGAKRKMFWHSN